MLSNIIPLPLLAQDDVNINDLYKTSQYAILSNNTRKTYESQWKLFVEWCAKYQISTWPAQYEVIIEYLNDRYKNNCSFATIQLSLHAIIWFYKINNFDLSKENTTMFAIITNLMKTYRRAQTQNDALQGFNRQAIVATIKIMQDMFYTIQASNVPHAIKTRDSAMLATAYCTAARQSELSRLILNDIEEYNDEYRIYIRYSKSDQFGTGRVCGVINGNIIYAAKFLKEWIDIHPINAENAPLFPQLHKSGECMIEKALSGVGISRRFKYWGELSGHAGLTGHSTRRGAATEAARGGRNIFDIMKLGGWRSQIMPTQYVENADALNNHTMRGII